MPFQTVYKVGNIVRQLWMTYYDLQHQNNSFDQIRGLIKGITQKNGLKISPKNYQLFKTELQYMGNTIFIKERRVCVKLLRGRLEAIQKLKPPMTIKGHGSFVVMVNLVSVFCPG